jgi:hypothetical protein
LGEAHRENKGLWIRSLDSFSRVVGAGAAYPDLDLVRKGVGVHAENRTAKGRGPQYSGLGSMEVLVEHPNTCRSAQQSGAD